jgi:hypothetical protein
VWALLGLTILLYICLYLSTLFDIINYYS